MKLYILAMAVAIAGCNANKDSNEGLKTSVPPSISSKESLSPGCYQMIIGQDSAMMNLNISGDSVSGILQYNRFEKDDNVGNFVGKIDSNKVIAWYKFRSEGVITVRQVIFKINEDKLAEAYGDVNASGDTAYFTYPHTLNYEENHPFRKIVCP